MQVPEVRTHTYKCGCVVQSIKGGVFENIKRCPDHREKKPKIWKNLKPKNN